CSLQRIVQRVRSALGEAGVHVSSVRGDAAHQSPACVADAIRIRQSGCKQTLCRPTFLGTSPSSLRQTAIRSLLQLGVDGLELAAQTRLQLAAVQEYQFAFGQYMDREQQLSGNDVGNGEAT